MGVKVSTYEFAAPGVLALPVLDGPISSRFESGLHPLLDRLNDQLDHRTGQQPEPDDGEPSETYLPDIEGDPWALSGELSHCAFKLCDAGEPELSLEVLDEGYRWGDAHIRAMAERGTPMEAARDRGGAARIRGETYGCMAVRTARKGNIDLALAIALNNDRILAHEGANHFDEVAYDRNNPYLMAWFAGSWLVRAAKVYEVVTNHEITKPSDGTADLDLKERFGDKLDLYSAVIAVSCSRGELPRSKYDVGITTNWLAVKAGETCTQLYKAGETVRADYLLGLDPAIASYTER